MVSISARGLKLIEAVAPSSEAIYAAMTRRYGARKLAELQDMLAALESSLSEMPVVGEASDAKLMTLRSGRIALAACILFEHRRRGRVADTGIDRLRLALILRVGVSCDRCFVWTKSPRYQFTPDRKSP